MTRIMYILDEALTTVYAGEDDARLALDVLEWAVAWGIITDPGDYIVMRPWQRQANALRFTLSEKTMTRLVIT